MNSEERINRINYLAKKKKISGLTTQELKEQKDLREEYLKEVRKNLKRQLDNIEFVD